MLSFFDLTTPAKRFRFVAVAEAITWAVLLVAMWAVHLRLHDASWRTGVPFFGAAALVLAATPLAFSELLAGAVLAVLVVVETRLVAAEAPVGATA